MTIDAPAPPLLPPRGAAFFDFDGTLIHGDSLPMFVAEVIGRHRTRLAFADAIRSGLHRHARGRAVGVDLRGTIKAILVRRTLAGLPVAEAAAAAERLVHRLRWHQPMVDAMRRHREAGCRVVVATGALDVYMPALLHGLPVDDLLATGLESVDGTLTGRLCTGNCVRFDKADRVRDWLTRHGPFPQTWGYGNRPSDLPMLALVDRPTVVRL